MPLRPPSDGRLRRAHRLCQERGGHALLGARQPRPPECRARVRARRQGVRETTRLVRRDRAARAQRRQLLRLQGRDQDEEGGRDHLAQARAATCQQQQEDNSKQLAFLASTYTNLSIYISFLLKV